MKHHSFGTACVMGVFTLHISGDGKYLFVQRAFAIPVCVFVGLESKTPRPSQRGINN